MTAAINYYRANLPEMFIKDFKDLKDWIDSRRGKSPAASTSSTSSDNFNERIRVPTLFIYGERDFAIAPETVRGVGDFIDAPYRETRIATSGHWVQQEAAQEVNHALRSFFEEV